MLKRNKLDQCGELATTEPAKVVEYRLSTFSGSLGGKAGRKSTFYSWVTPLPYL